MTILDVSVKHEQGAFALQASFRSDGKLTALFGPSGSGKTTIVNAIGGLEYGFERNFGFEPAFFNCDANESGHSAHESREDE